jgi:hypothetical protein
MQEFLLKIKKIIVINMENLKDFNDLRSNFILESEDAEKTEKIQVLLSEEDLSDLTRKISKKALAKGEAPVSVSHYVRSLIRRDLGKTEGN